MPSGSIRPGQKSPQLLATDIGYLTLDWLSGNGAAHVLGTSSKGIFIRTENKRIIFISDEPFRSPLTINLLQPGGLLRSVCAGTPVNVSGKEIFFPEYDLSISFARATVWRGQHAPEYHGQPADRKHHIQLACEKIAARNSIAGLAPLIPLLAQSSSDHPHLNLNSYQAHIFNMYRKICALEQRDIPTLLIPVLGAGDGLTPSGDDFTVGFLLALNRWGFAFLSGHQPRKLNRQVLEAANLKTTTLSINLIECAAQGQGDERLIAALDWLMCASSSEHACLDELLNWGKSSGGDVLVGFLFALSFLEKRTFTE